uniref:Uncharacterized protein n=1 Tax=Oryza glumipatula TaxID=40148 RepID=A0A0D9Y941_9ORYZ
MSWPSLGRPAPAEPLQADAAQGRSRYTRAASCLSRARTRSPVPPHTSHAPISDSRRANLSERLFCLPFSPSSFSGNTEHSSSSLPSNHSKLPPRSLAKSTVAGPFSATTARHQLCHSSIALKIPLDSQELKWTKKAMLKLPKDTFHKASHSLGWTCGRGFGQVDMIRNGGTHESNDRLALLRPSKCPTARTDQYPTRQ